MNKRLKDFFPIIRSKKEILEEIDKRPELKNMYEEWDEEQKEEFLNFCTGAKGVKMLYDSFFKEVMSPEYTPERLNDFLSLLLKEPVRIAAVLPNDTSRLADESSLLIMDIIVQFDDGRLANVEVQKIGYYFPGERSACYSADLLLRQYKRLRGEKHKKFSYRDIQTVFVIVLFESSPKVFLEFPEVYEHYFEQRSDTGIILNQPQKFLYLALDVFRKKQDNEGVTIHNRLEAWLTFLCRDEPEIIIELIEQYPEFKPLYEDIYELCLNIEKVMAMFSKELREMDRNTVRLMIDDMQATIEQQQKKLDEQLKQHKVEMEEQSKQYEQEMEERSKKHECEMTEVVAKMKKMDEHMMVLNQRIAELEKLLDNK